MTTAVGIEQASRLFSIVNGKQKSRNRLYLVFVIALTLSTLPLSAMAKGVFSTRVTSGLDTFSDSYETVKEAFDQLDQQEIEEVLPTYSEANRSPVNAVVDYMGLEMLFSFADGSDDLIMNIPSLNLTEVFQGQDRDDSADLLVDYLKGGGLGSVQKIHKELVHVSATHPVAGNPASLMGSMVSSDYAKPMSMNPMEFTSTPGGQDLLAQETGIASSTSQGAGSSVGVDLSVAQLDLDGDEANTQTIIFEYQHQFKDPLKVLRFKMPLGITDTEGSISYNADVGVTFSYPLTRSWTLTPGLSYGVGGSDDLGASASINGYSLLSSYRFVFGNYLYNIGNMIGYYETGSVSLGDYDVDPGVSNTVYRNGLVILKPKLIFNVPTMMQLILIDTRYSGDDLYTEHYYELGFAFGLITDKDLLAKDTFNLGLTYLDSADSDIKGYKVNFGYRF